MPQQPFTNAGVQAKKAELYALSDNELIAQSNQIQNSFKNWMTANFALDASQAASLANLDDEFTRYVAFQVGFTVRHRGPIIIDKHPSENTGKLIKTTGDMTVQDGPAGFSMSGTLTIDISFV
ncbi:hypothetical protein [Mucilaginibacter paludis]|uniref:Uncharacterized protein n=1 Tax=Mucilaginibacter paludis DSM 18603 TaxID=714943 RepID=H1YDW4_9SPHI|nr:hypothetical protein [Mucilaginibacter paludis]EHQ24304.1 hypothetical protein Mucpa_0101 [Mucilaginibacter paludis DSM 18603]